VYCCETNAVPQHRSLGPDAPDTGRELIQGSEAICRAALYAGCDFFAGYPITPATPILLRMMKEMPQNGGVAIQGEDEIASIGMCIAASMAGRKAMTATSGPGISLYSENIGLAVMGEVPLVIVDVQRLGPATGGATTGAQGDVQFIRWVTSGGLPMVVLVPGTIESMFGLTVRAFNLAEMLRTPVFVLSSKDMVLSMHTLDHDELVWPEVVNRTRFTESGRFVPYQFDTSSDIPPFLPIGSDKLVRFTTSMHDEHAYLTKAPDRVRRKLLHLDDKITKHADLIESVREDLEDDAECLLLAYGVNAELCREVVEKVRGAGEKSSLLVLESLFPIPEAAISKALHGVKRVILPEMNLGLYAQAIEHLIPPKVELVSIPKVDGELLTVEDVITQGGLM
jgi:2-oxoglutarate ferredoxin oxidoreductase subunit alpha